MTMPQVEVITSVERRRRLANVLSTRADQMWASPGVMLPRADGARCLILHIPRSTKLATVGTLVANRVPAFVLEKPVHRS